MPAASNSENDSPDARAKRRAGIALRHRIVIIACTVP
jgi:hypothetical protein